MNKEQLERIANALGAISNGFAQISNGLASLKLTVKSMAKAETPSAETEMPKPIAKSAQLDLFDFRAPDYGAKPRAPERGFENEVNPAHVAAGAIGGRATAGVKRAASPDRRKPGTVNVDRMDVQAKREYWRWAGDRKAARKAGCRVLGWDEWKTLKQGLTNP